MPTPLACGIDFGTSNSTVALSGGGAAPRLIILEHGKTTLPSALFFKNNITPVYGRTAIDHYLGGDEGRLIRGLKKILGTSLMEERTLIGNKAISFMAILQNFITHLKSRADEQASESVTNVVMGRPVHFHDHNHNADQLSQDTLESIARAAGFHNVEFLFEPIAAAFAHETGIEQEQLALVVDLGGGTSDFTIIRLSRNYMDKPDRSDDILATTGTRVGGTNFDTRLSLHSFMPHLGLGTEYRDSFDPDKLLPMPLTPYTNLSDWAMVHHAQTNKAIAETRDLHRRSESPEHLARLLRVQENHLGYALLEEVEKTKIALTQAEDHRATLGALDHSLSFPVTRHGFESAITADIEKITLAMDECLTAAHIKPAQIQLLILTGGSTELPLINHLVREKFPTARLSLGNRLDSVGLGLAHHAAKIF